LTLPVATGRVPALVLVHGSGPNDRDETLGPNKTFKDLAVGLASRGIAVLRYDKRSLVYGAKLAALKNPTVKDEVIDDVLEAVALLRSDPAIDPDRIFVLGHSLGGMLIPRIGAADPKLAGLITLAGSVRPIEQLIAAQLQYLAEADGVISPAEQQALDEAKKALATLSALTADDLKTPAKIANAPVSYWLDLRGYDPPAMAAKLPQRMLVLQGGRDYQVTTVDFDRWKTGTLRQDERRIPSLSGAQSFVSARRRQEPARRVRGAWACPGGSDRGYCELGKALNDSREQIDALPEPSST
jgi:pimeloyl-ACP methyl ester carboxylesterase